MLYLSMVISVAGKFKKEAQVLFEELEHYSF